MPDGCPDRIVGVVGASDLDLRLEKEHHGIDDIGRKKGKDAGSFIGEGSDQIKGFYGDVLQRIRAWRPSAPKLRDRPRDDETADGSDDAEASTVDEPDSDGFGAA